MAAKPITEEYVADLCRRIEEGEEPKKDTEISVKEFTRRMLPHLKEFLTKGYTHKEIAEFFGHVSVADLKKAVAKDVPEKKPESKLDNKPAKTADKKEPAKTVAVKASAKTSAKST